MTHLKKNGRKIKFNLMTKLGWLSFTVVPAKTTFVPATSM